VLRDLRTEYAKYELRDKRYRANVSVGIPIYLRASYVSAFD